MEIEFSEKQLRSILAALVLLALMLPVLGLIGKPITPVAADGAVAILTWHDWQLWKGERAYDREISILRDDAVDLAKLLNDPEPSPVAAQLIMDRVQRDTAQGLPELEASRLALTTSAQAVRNWASGMSERSAAENALNDALELLK